MKQRSMTVKRSMPVILLIMVLLFNYIINTSTLQAEGKLSYEDVYIKVNNNVSIKKSTVTLKYGSESITLDKCTVSSDDSMIDITESTVTAKASGIHFIKAEYNGESTVLYILSRSTSEKVYTVYSEDYVKAGGAKKVNESTDFKSIDAVCKLLPEYVSLIDNVCIVLNVEINNREYSIRHIRYNGQKTMYINNISASESLLSDIDPSKFSSYDISSITVTLQESAPDMESIVSDRKYVDFDRIYSPILFPASVVVEIDDLDALLSMKNKPNTVIVYADASLNISNKDGSKQYGSLQEVMGRINMDMLCAVYVRDEATCDALIAYAKSYKIKDGFVISDKPELVKKVRNSYKNLRGIVVFDTNGDSSQETLDKIVFTTNENLAKVAIIKEDIATKKNVTYIQNRLITLWVEESADKDVMLHNSIQSGAHGILTDTPEKLYAAYGSYEDATVLVRNSFVIGHRSLPSKAPENSIESALLAYKAGVDCIEVDIRYTKDKVLMNFHDNDIDNLTDGKGSFSGKTYEDLQKIHLIRSGAYGTFKDYPQVAIPTFREICEFTAARDVLIFLEIKGSEKGLATDIANMIKEYKLENKVCIISFDTGMLKEFSAALPGVSVGLLTSNPSGNTEKIVSSVLSSVNTLNSTFNPNGTVDINSLKALLHRGVTMWPWTYGAGNTKDAYMIGIGGVTTDTCDVLSKVPTGIELDLPLDISLNLASPSGKESVTFNPTVYDRVGKHDLGESKAPSLVLLEGEECVSVNGNTVTAKGEGCAYMMYRYEYDEDGMNFSLYTQVIKVNVVNDSTATPSPYADKEENNSVWVIVAIVAGVLAIAAVTVILIIDRKKKK